MLTLLLHGTTGLLAMATIGMSDSGLATLSRPMHVSGLGLASQLDTQAASAVRKAVRSVASSSEEEEQDFIMQSSAGGRFDSVDTWESLIASSWAFSDDDNCVPTIDDYDADYFDMIR